MALPAPHLRAIETDCQRHERARCCCAATRFVNVKAHQGEPLNEAADSTAAELDPCRPLSLDAGAVYYYHRDAPVEWDSQLRDHLVQVAADVNLQRIGREQ